MTHGIVGFWPLLETNFPPGGPRAHLRELLGGDDFGALGAAGILKHWGVADRYPCPQPGGDGCPLVLFERDDGTFVGVCGNDPPECPIKELAPTDVEVVAVDPLDLCEEIGKALQIRLRVEELPDLRNAYHVGTFIPEAGIKHAVYFLVRCNEREYVEAFNALRMQAAGKTLAVLIPTERFLTEGLRRQASAAGIVLVPLLETVRLTGAGLQALEDPLTIFADIGRLGGAAGMQSPLVAKVFMRGGGDGRPAWRDVDDAGYRGLLESESSYDIFADELTKTVTRGTGTTRKPPAKVNPTYFKMIRAAIDKRSNYDPGTGEDDGLSAKQIFQNARKAFDIKANKSWALFKTDIVDKHAVYRFDPDPGVGFVFVFSPNP